MIADETDMIRNCIKLVKQLITFSLLVLGFCLLSLSVRNTNLERAEYQVQEITQARDIVNFSHNRYQNPSKEEIVKDAGKNELRLQKNETEKSKHRKIMLRSSSGEDAFILQPSLERLLTYFKYENVSFETYQLDASIGQTLPLVRVLPDVRPETCKTISFSGIKNRYLVSVIIPFYNELWSVLLRNIHSLLARSPGDLLVEILLVDDNSSTGNLKAPLENYIQWLPNIRLIRNEKREGLIRARMIGARHAKGNILVFLDAHVEVNEGWLEPLVAIIAQDRTTVAVPDVSYIEPINLTYSAPGRPLYRLSGSFTWELDYLWSAYKIPDRGAHLPYITSTMIGCGFAVHKKYFFQIGGFDEGLKIWGGENLEISFRTWQCGGSMKIVPCSVLGHVFRKTLPYNFSGEIVTTNLQRVAEVWMDEYKQYFYQTVPIVPPPISEKSKASLEKRKELRDKLNCKPFSWYLQYVAVDVIVPKPNSYLFGQIKSVELEHMCALVEETNHITFDSCFFVSRNHFFALTDNNAIVSVQNNLCLTMTVDVAGLTEMQRCDDNSLFQRWSFEETMVPDHIKTKLVGVDFRKPVGRISSTLAQFNLCLAVGKYFSVQTILAKTCDTNDPAQYFVFTHRLNHNRIINQPQV